MRQVYNVLFVSNGENGLGLIAEAFLNQWDRERFRAFSANGGTRPAHPLAVEWLKSHRLWNDQRSTPIERFTGESGEPMDFVISLGQSPPKELWDSFPGTPVKARWRITDPVAGKSDPTACKARFRRSFVELENRIKLFALVWSRSFGDRTLAA